MLDMTKKKIAYEWVLVLSKGDDIVLTENQYQVFKENIKESKIFFGDLGFSPSFVTQFYRRPATNWLKDKYPCKACYTTGRRVDNTDWCEACGGTGVCLPNKQENANT